MEKISKISLHNFKAYQKKQCINLSDINIFMGANSSGKSTCIQSLLTLKQTCESKQEHIGLLSTGKYTTLGSFKDILNAQSKDDHSFSIGLAVDSGQDEESYDHLEVCWEFQENDRLINGVELKSLELITDNKIKFELQKNSEYIITMDDKTTDFKATMNNIFINKVIIPFDPEYNVKLADFLKETIDWALTNKKNTIAIHKNDMVYNQLNKLTFDLYKYRRESTIEEHHFGKRREGPEIFQIITDINNKINLQKPKNYADLKDQDDFHDLSVFFYSSLISNDNIRLDGFYKIWEKYKNIYPIEKPVKVDYSEMPLNDFLALFERHKSLEGSFSAMQRYNQYIKSIVDNIRYLGPLRETPKSLYHWDIDIDPNYVGPKGEHFPSVLSTLSAKEINTFLPGEDSRQRVPFYDALDLWCKYLNVASEISVNSEYSFGMSIKVQNINSDEADIMNVGVGTSQVLPVLIMGLISPKNSIVIYEQPELHLHPYSQSRLADFFVAMAKTGKQFIIETHSEYMLHRFRYNLLREKILETSINLNFFSNTECGTSVYAGKLDQNGSIDYPSNFVDQNQSLFIEMLTWEKNR